LFKLIFNFGFSSTFPLLRGPKLT